MDTISRENNGSMLPVGAIIVGVVALLLGGYAAISLSKLNKTVAAQEEKIARIDSLETQVATAASDAASAKKAIGDNTRQLGDYARQTQGGFDTITSEMVKFREEITNMQGPKKPAAGKAAGGTPAVAGPDEYIVKAGDSSGTKIATNNGVSIADLMAVNPGVEWKSLKIGQKLKLPAKR